MGFLVKIVKPFQLLYMVFVLETSVDPVEMMHLLSSHLGLHCFLMSHYYDGRHKCIEGAFVLGLDSSLRPGPEVIELFCARVN